MNRLPDFIIIGAMKCATSTLHEQLAAQPGIFMSEPKEPNFFSDDAVYTRGVSWYTSLFRDAKAGDICGESSTHYTKLPTHPNAVGRMSAALGMSPKLIYVMRHPIDRLVSHYIHEWTQRVISCPIDEAIDRHPELIDYSRYSMQLRPYLQTFGAQCVLPVFFDRVTAHPHAELERVCRFIGYRGVPRWADELEQQNASAQRLRKSGWRDAILNLPGAAALRRTLVPQSIRDRIKGFWAMKQRPELSQSNQTRLEQVFDRDLAQVGQWLGIDLRCGNFAEQTRERLPAWSQLEGAGIA